MSTVEPPVRLCCMQRHWGSVCLDGKVMCAMCYGRFDVDDLAIASDNTRWDVCKVCDAYDKQRVVMRDFGISHSQLMQDSVTTANFLPGYGAYGAYGNGLYTNAAAVQALFPRSPVEVIDVLNEGIGTFLDVESGDAVPADAPGYLANRISAGVWRPGIYGGASTWVAIWPLVASLNRDTYRIWTAHYTGIPHLCNQSCYPGLPDGFLADATQYYGGVTVPFDLSLLGPGFLQSPPQPIHPVVVNTYPNLGAPMSSIIAQIPIGANGEGWAIYDGGINSEPGATSLKPAIKWSAFIAATPYCVNPVTDTDRVSPNVGVQERNGYLFIRASSAPPSDTVVAYVVFTT